MKVKDIMKKLNLGTQPNVTIQKDINSILTAVSADNLLKNRLFTWESTEINRYADYTVNSFEIRDGRKIVIFVQ